MPGSVQLSGDDAHYVCFSKYLGGVIANTAWVVVPLSHGTRSPPQENYPLRLHVTGNDHSVMTFLIALRLRYRRAVHAQVPQHAARHLHA